MRKSLHDVIDFNQTDLIFRCTHEQSGSRPTFLQITSTLGTLRLLMDPAMDGIGELEALPQDMKKGLLVSKLVNPSFFFSMSVESLSFNK